MKCPNCGCEYTGNFCPDCGIPAPQNYNGQQQTGFQPIGQPDYQQQYGQQQYGHQQYGQQQYGQPAYRMPNPGITKREIVTCIIFTIITCGIYAIYWFVKLTDDTNLLVNDYGVSNGENLTSGGMAFLLSLVTCGIYGYYWAYKQGERIDRIRAARGMSNGSLGVLYIILQFVGLSIVAYALMQNELNTLNN